MFEIWAKIIDNDKIKKNKLFKFEGEYQKENFYNYVSNICHEMDIATPVILSKHAAHFTEFNNTAFLKDDFVDEVYFDKLVLEFCREQKKKSRVEDD